MAKATMFCAYIPTDFSTTDFWDNSNGREIADRYGLKQVGVMHWLSLEQGASLLMELNRIICGLFNEAQDLHRTATTNDWFWDILPDEMKEEVLV